MSLPAPSPLLLEQRTAIEAAAARGPVLDLACGRGRHARVVAGWGLRVVALDRRLDALRELRADAPRVETLRADLETGHRIPLRSATLGAILIFRYLHRSLVEEIRRCLAPGGLLLYETFTVRQLELGWGPRSPRFLLEPGELPRLFASFEILEAREGLGGAERPAHLAWLVARRRGAPQLCAPS